MSTVERDPVPFEVLPLRSNQFARHRFTLIESGPAQKRFTLIELLVVVAIISVLAALLLPALGKAKQRAKDMLCVSNIRQNAVAVMQYTDDYDGRIPHHWGNGLMGITHQSSKSPSSRWIIVNDYGKYRAGRLWPEYIDGRTFYCPTDKVQNYDRRVNTSGGHGLGQYYNANGTPWTGWSGQYIFSYSFPAVITPLSQSNFGGQWTGVGPNFWQTTNGPNSYSLFKRTMLKPRLDANASPMKVLFWDKNGMHDYRIANVAYVDGSVLVFKEHREVYTTKVHASWARGLGHPSVMDWFTEMY